MSVAPFASDWLILGVVLGRCSHIVESKWERIWLLKGTLKESRVEFLIG
jgi:hypothetical protein